MTENQGGEHLADLCNISAGRLCQTGKDSMMNKNNEIIINGIMENTRVADTAVSNGKMTGNTVADNVINKDNIVNADNVVNKDSIVNADNVVNNVNVINNDSVINNDKTIKNKRYLTKKSAENRIHNSPHNLGRNIGVDYLYRFTSNFGLTGAVWVLYLSHKGMSLGQIGLLEGFFHMVSFLFEVPTGAMADLIGRKRTLLLGRISAIISGLLMITADHFWGYAIAFAFSAASYNLNSGSEEALVYDSLKLSKREKDFLKINGRLNFIQEAGSSFASFLGGIIAELSFFYAYIGGMLINAAAFFTGAFFSEPAEKHRREKMHPGTVKVHFRTCIWIFRHNRPVRRVLIFYPAVTAFSTTVYFYGQQHLSDMGFNKVQISFVILLSGVFASLGALSSDKFSRIFGDKEKYVGATGLAVFIAAFGIHNNYAAIAAFLMQDYFGAILYPISSNALNVLIPSEQRATIISVSSVMFSAAMILIFPVCGFLGDRIGLNYVFYILGILIVLFQLIFIRKTKN